jgi:hypothetical protein
MPRATSTCDGSVGTTPLVVARSSDVDENPLTSSLFNVRSIPLLVLLKGGKEAGRLEGAPQSRDYSLESLL